MTLKKLALLSTTLALSACANMSTSTPTAQTDLPNGRWVEVTRQAGPSAEIEFKDGRITASVGCNRLFAPASIENGILKTGTLASTMMMCPPDVSQKEEALKTLLSSQPKIMVQQKSMSIEGKDQTLSLKQFLPDMSQAKTSFVYLRPKANCKGDNCWQIAQEKQGPWSDLKQNIHGFQPEENLAYRLRVFDLRGQNNASEYQLVLDQVIETEVIPNK